MAAAVGSAEDVRNVANYVLSLSASPHDSVRAAQGKENFAACAACHGMDGKGMAGMGAPNLTDGVWLHGWGEEAIIRSINNGYNNEMPGQSALLNEAQINVLASYVWGMSNKSAN
jgi:cytochrome c oxidase cbb3-type subunit 3